MQAGAPVTLSVVTVAFNAAATIGATCASVVAQRDPSIAIEHIVLDGASTDGTLAAVEPYRAGIAHLSSRPDAGLYYAMNAGLKLATGEYVAFLHADDAYVHPRVLVQAAVCLRETAVDAVYGDLEVVDGDGRVVRVWRGGRYRSGAFLRGWMPPHPTFIARTKALRSAGGFNTNLRYSADYELMLRFIHVQRRPVAYLPDVAVRMRAGGLSNATWTGRLRAHREDRQAWAMNGVQPALWTLPLKPLRKISQFVPGVRSLGA
jgi:glycosyltransferase involved in cell wall biosynthesis